MIPGSTHSDNLSEIWKEHSIEEEKTLDAGVLEGKFSSPPTLLALFIILISLAAAFLALGLYQRDMNEMGLAGLYEVMAAISAFAAFCFLGLAGYIFDARRRAKEEAMYKVESRDYDFTPVTGPEVIKVRCRYCGTLNSVGAKNCVACGATM